MKNYLKPGSKSIKNVNLVNGPFLGTFMLRVGVIEVVMVYYITEQWVIV